LSSDTDRINVSLVWNLGANPYADPGRLEKRFHFFSKQLAIRERGRRKLLYAAGVE
jgi:hypothetical protein